MRMFFIFIPFLFLRYRCLCCFRSFPLLLRHHPVIPPHGQYHSCRQRGDGDAAPAFGQEGEVGEMTELKAHTFDQINQGLQGQEEAAGEGYGAAQAVTDAEGQEKQGSRKADTE